MTRPPLVHRRTGLLGLALAATLGDALPVAAQSPGPMPVDANETLVVPGDEPSEALPPAYGDDAFPGEGRQPLALAEVLESVEASYPLLIAIEQETALASGELLAARGSFDSRLFARGEAAPTGYYDRFTTDLGIEQPTRLWGSRLYAGYRLGRGDFPSYYGASKTNESGELRAGLEIPLLKSGAIDEPRAKLRAGEIKRRAAEPKIALERLAILRQASETYWNWVALGLAVDVERHLLRTAEDRRSQLEGRAARGAIPAIQVVDNERLILDRAIRLRGAERDAQEAAVALSLYYRDAEGAMRIPDHARLPRDFPTERAWDERRLVADIDRAQARHPILRELALRREGLHVSLALDRNALLPDLRVGVEGSKDIGRSAAGISSIGSFSTNPNDDTEVKASVRFEVPALQRTARGRVATRRAELVRLENETRYARDAIEAEIRRAMVAVVAAYDQTRLARESYALSTRLQLGEERKLELGSSNLIDVNIRELQAAEAARSLVFAQAAYFRAIARYEAAIAERVDPGEAAPAAP
ncbi:MAG: TolC family protein [Myxococcota bacterium]